MKRFFQTVIILILVIVAQEGSQVWNSQLSEKSSQDLYKFEVSLVSLNDHYDQHLNANIRYMACLFPMKSLWRRSTAAVVQSWRLRAVATE